VTGGQTSNLVRNKSMSVSRLPVAICAAPE
jgi:hypothetical protein